MDVKKVIESLSTNELKILPYLEEKEIFEICRKSNLDKTSVLRSLGYLKNKGIVNVNYEKKRIVDLGSNGILYKKNGFPERRLLDLINEKRVISLDEAKKQSGLSEEEFKISVGTLKKKSLIDIRNRKIISNAFKGEASKKIDEEILLEMLPASYESLSQKQLQILKDLQRRKDIVKIKRETLIKINVTELGRKIINSKISNENSIEQLTPDILRKEKSWKGKRFRRYDIESLLPKITGGKRHFVNQSSDYARKVWTEMGFKEMNGNLIESSFWVFDALFTPQDHPAREMQDTFFISRKIELPDKKLVETVKKTHEKGIEGSKGWKYQWNFNEAKKTVLRTHTTCLSARKLYELSNLPKEKRRGKFFAIGKNFRNEAVDWSHGFEFNQTEGIVVSPNLNFRNLLGYLKEFFKKMGFEKIRFRPAYFPYTEPSVEIEVWHPEKKLWLELGGAGIFRPEVVVPLLGENITVLAWGPGFDRMVMDYYKIKDLRELYKNDINQLRKIKFWMKT